MDESLKKHGSLTRFIVGSCFFRKDRWLALCEQHEKKVHEIGGKRKLEAIDELLSAISGYAVLVYADLPKVVCGHDTDGTRDIPEMSRRDNIWSQLTLDAVATGLAWLQSGGRLLGAVDLYYDPKDLKSAHRDAWENYFRQNLVKFANEDLSRYPGSVAQFGFGAIQSVEKPSHRSQISEYQRGVNLVHHFCSQARILISRGPTERVCVKDRTDNTLATLMEFTNRA
jgi:hypothetical protein